MAATAAPDSYTIEAFNVSHASENKIHDDTVAQKLGFTGGLVPGVEVFAYASHLPVAHWGRAFLERGTMEARFGKPVYDGRIATARAEPLADGGLSLIVESDGVTCATGTAHLPKAAGSAPHLEAYPFLEPPTDLAKRPPADQASLAVGKLLCTAPARLDDERLDTYLRDVRECDPLYSRERLAHPGLLLRLCNSTLRDNVVLPPWIHVGSSVRYLSVARVGETLAARARVVANYDKKGHRLVDLDCLVLANDRPVAQVMHTAIYQLRHLAA